MLPPFPPEVPIDLTMNDTRDAHSFGTVPREKSQGKPQTLAEILFWQDSPTLRKELEQFRVSYESEFGETDLTKRYTSTLPRAQQIFLIENFPKRFFDGLPPFVKAYWKGKMQSAAKEGRLDNWPDQLLRLFIQGQMQLDLGRDR